MGGVGGGYNLHGHQLDFYLKKVTSEAGLTMTLLQGRGGRGEGRGGEGRGGEGRGGEGRGGEGSDIGPLEVLFY